MKTNLSNLSKIVAILFFTLCLSNFAKSQDLIYKKNKEVLVVKIIEVGIDEIKYKDFSKQDGMTLVIAKAEVYKVKYENGKEQIFLDEMENPNQYSDQKRNAIKMDFLAPLFYHFTFGYERSLKPGESITFDLGIVGLGKNFTTGLGANYSASGAFIRAGFKFIRTPDFYLRGMRYAHILKGSYIKPEIIVGSITHSYRDDYNYNFLTNTYSTIQYNESNTTFCIMLNLGNQAVFNDVFLVDYFVGLGYGFDSNTKVIGYDYATIGSDLRFQAGLKIGFLFK